MNGFSWRWVTFYGGIFASATVTAIFAPTGVGLPVALGILAIAPAVRGAYAMREGRHATERRLPDGQIHDAEDPPR
jgi:hypothetical protein